MILVKVDSNKYKEDFVSKFTSFGNKSPIILSFAIDELGVTVTHENSGTQYFYAWDFTIPVKSFIHQIKEDLSFRHYPRLSRTVVEKVAVTPERAAELIAAGTSVDAVPAEEVVTNTYTYRIDKILAMKDEFVLVDEATGEQLYFKMNGSGIYFLKNYREGVFKNIEEAGDVFFKKSTLTGRSKAE